MSFSSFFSHIWYATLICHYFVTKKQILLSFVHVFVSESESASDLARDKYVRRPENDYNWIFMISESLLIKRSLNCELEEIIFIKHPFQYFYFFIHSKI
jgi:hypothetical protein